MSIRKIIVVICVYVVAVNFGYAQYRRIHDAGFWASLIGDGKINKKIFYRAMWRWRQTGNFLVPNSYYFDFGIGYKITSNFKFSLHYAFNPTRAFAGYYRNIHQYYVSVSYKYPINKYLELINRVIMQHATHLFVTDFWNDNGYKPYYRTDIRERVGFQINLSSHSNIFAADEIMYTISYTPIFLTRNRFYCGYETALTPSLKGKFYFVLQSAYHSLNSYNYDLFIYGIDLSYKLPW